MNTIKNRVQLIGNLGNDPEIRKFDNGKTLARLSLATSDTYRDEDGKKVTDTQWHSLTAWGQTALIAEKYLKKGSEIAIEGKLVHRNYENKEGKKQFITEVVVQEMLMLGKKEKE
jgi:single-strand DNA-binding protein